MSEILNSKHVRAAIAVAERVIRAADRHAATNHKNKRFPSREAYDKWRDNLGSAA